MSKGEFVKEPKTEIEWEVDSVFLSEYIHPRLNFYSFYWDGEYWWTSDGRRIYFYTGSSNVRLVPIPDEVGCYIIATCVSSWSDEQFGIRITAKVTRFVRNLTTKRNFYSLEEIFEKEFHVRF